MDTLYACPLCEIYGIWLQCNYYRMTTSVLEAAKSRYVQSETCLEILRTEILILCTYKCPKGLTIALQCCLKIVFYHIYTHFARSSCLALLTRSAN